MTWRVAYSLDVLLDEINAYAPDRSKVSDGSIGDAAHASRSSDHNPWRQAGGQGVVGARDFTHDPAGGLDCDLLAALLASQLGKHPALGSGAYVIWEAQIISTDRLSEGWRSYSGSNEHRSHLHLSVGTNASDFDSRAPWDLFATKEDPMADYAEQLDTLIATVSRTERKLDKLRENTFKRDKALKTQVRALLAEARQDDRVDKSVIGRLEAIQATLDDGFADEEQPQS